MPESGQSIMEIVLSETDLRRLQTKELYSNLSAYINSLITDHFDELISLLYRLDVNEKKLKDLLQQHATEDAAGIIAALIIERQEQKIKTRELFRPSHNIPEEERW